MNLPYKISYTLNEQDYLTNQLYAAAQSPVIMRKRSFNRISTMFFYLLLGLFFHLYLEKTSLGLLFVATGFLWFFLYPIFERKRYHKHFKKHIAENYKSRFDQAAELTIAKDHLYLKDDETEGRLDLDAISNLVELKELFLIRLVEGQQLIVPKCSLEDKVAFLTAFNEVGVKYLDERNWEWK